MAARVAGNYCCMHVYVMHLGMVDGQRSNAGRQSWQGASCHHDVGHWRRALYSSLGFSGCRPALPLTTDGVSEDAVDLPI